MRCRLARCALQPSNQQYADAGLPEVSAALMLD